VTGFCSLLKKHAQVYAFQPLLFSLISLNPFSRLLFNSNVRARSPFFFFSHFVVLLFSNFDIEEGWLIGLVFRIDIYIPVLFPEGWKVLDYPACIV
jgi:hypothetical protein